MPNTFTKGVVGLETNLSNLTDMAATSATNHHIQSSLIETAKHGKKMIVPAHMQIESM
jgi:hypothetical protein